ncbi:PadR family transcriptional regulator [Nocardioides alcanivorans]|uniref:PadR family transcriptional regulator n=1 Tax=Nocardioides alcanivorans TaxID=2897352 RepID=UPI001F1695EE|nr:PadR family transcriptional regulator [Nocardioides alcanivorans]
MPSQEAPLLTLIEAAVLGLLVDRPQHGFELAKAFERDNWLGEIFTTQRPVVYRALNTLERKGLLTEERREASSRGPARTVLRCTSDGSIAFQEWLETPVRHLRDVRLELLIKLALHEHHGLDVQPFISRQIEHFRPIHDALQVSPTPTDGTGRQLALWRKEASHTVMRFLEKLREGPARP